MNPIKSERFFFNTEMILNPSIELHSYLLSEVKHTLGERQVESTATFWYISQCSIKNTVNLWGAEPWHRMCWAAETTQPSLSFTSTASPVKGGHTHTHTTPVSKAVPPPALNQTPTIKMNSCCCTWRNTAVLISKFQPINFCVQTKQFFHSS